MKNLLLTLLALTMSIAASSQILNPVLWSYAAKRKSAAEAAIYLKAKIAPGWHIYALNIPKGKNMSTYFNFYPSNDYKVLGSTVQPKPKTKYEEGSGITVCYFENYAIFMQKTKLSKVALTVVSGEVTYMACDASRCLPPETLAFNIPVE